MNTTSNKVSSFEFTSYSLVPSKKEALFSYAIHFKNTPTLHFTEKLSFPKPITYSLKLKAFFQDTHIALGMSYYKLYCPPKIILAYSISKKRAQFWSTVYKNGLGEFLFKNKLDPKRIASFPFDSKIVDTIIEYPRKNRSLLGVGGGKDSIVAIELLKKTKHDITGFVVETQRSSEIIKNILRIAEIPSLTIKRTIDPKLFNTYPDSYNGHVPITAIIATIGSLCCALYDYHYTIFSNEAGSDESNYRYKDININHQWSKSSTFEKLYQQHLKGQISPDIYMFSVLRPFNELRIAQTFSQYTKYHNAFSSCNTNFSVHKDRPKKLWCTNCPKCASTFLLLSPWINKNKLIKMFGKNMLDDPLLLTLYRDLLGFGKLKPFECVGTFDELRAALYASQKSYRSTIVSKTYYKKTPNGQTLLDNALSTSQALSVPSQFRFVGMNNILILGYGIKGKNFKNYLAQKYPYIKIGIADQTRSVDYLKAQDKYDIVFKTSGIPKRLITRQYITDTNLFFSQINNMSIGVTGTKGKSTTSALIAHILKTAGKKVELIGNFGIPALHPLLKKIDPKTIFVLELSSYELDDCEYSPNIAVALNLYTEHVPYHENRDNYFMAKQNIIKHQRTSDVFIYNQKQPEFRQWARLASSITHRIDTKPNPSDYPSLLLGKHNVLNMQAAIVATKQLKISDNTIKSALKTFKPLPHRLENIGTYNDITFYDDAISTTPESTIMAIKTLKQVDTIFLGGTDRGYDFRELEKIIRSSGIRNIVLFPDTGDRILQNSKGLTVLKTHSMKEAVSFAYDQTGKDKICLLSTASPSYSLWKNFEAKGSEFKKWVKKFSQREMGGDKGT